MALTSMHTDRKRGRRQPKGEEKHRIRIDAPVEQTQRHVIELYWTLSQLHTTYDGHRTVVVVTHAWCESNGTLPQLGRDPRPAVRIHAKLEFGDTHLCTLAYPYIRRPPSHASFPTPAASLERKNPTSESSTGRVSKDEISVS